MADPYGIFQPPFGPGYQPSYQWFPFVPWGGASPQNSMPWAPSPPMPVPSFLGYGNGAPNLAAGIGGAGSMPLPNGPPVSQSGQPVFVNGQWKVYVQFANGQSGFLPVSQIPTNLPWMGSGLPGQPPTSATMPPPAWGPLGPAGGANGPPPGWNPNGPSPPPPLGGGQPSGNTSVTIPTTGSGGGGGPAYSIPPNPTTPFPAGQSPFPPSTYGANYYSGTVGGSSGPALVPWQAGYGGPIQAQIPIGPGYPTGGYPTNNFQQTGPGLMGIGGQAIGWIGIAQQIQAANQQAAMNWGALVPQIGGGALGPVPTFVPPLSTPSGGLGQFFGGAAGVNLITNPFSSGYGNFSGFIGGSGLGGATGPQLTPDQMLSPSPAQIMLGSGLTPGMPGSAPNLNWLPGDPGPNNVAQLGGAGGGLSMAGSSFNGGH